jgi:hypothetical protein
VQSSLVKHKPSLWQRPLRVLHTRPTPQSSLLKHCTQVQAAPQRWPLPQSASSVSGVHKPWHAVAHTPSA